MHLICLFTSSTVSALCSDSVSLKEVVRRVRENESMKEK